LPAKKGKCRGQMCSVSGAAPLVTETEFLSLLCQQSSDLGPCISVTFSDFSPAELMETLVTYGAYPGCVPIYGWESRYSNASFEKIDAENVSPDDLFQYLRTF